MKIDRALVIFVALALQACSMRATKPAITGSGFTAAASAAPSTTALSAPSTATTPSQGTATQSPSPSPTPVITEIKSLKLADESDGKKYLEYIDPTLSDQTWIKLGEVQTLPVGTQLHHWGKPADIQYWVKNGISEQDIDQSRDNPDKSDAMGGGFYVSKDPVDSSSYGTNCLIAQTSTPALLLKTSGNKSRYVSPLNAFIINDKLSVKAATIAALGIDGILYTETWIVTITAKLLTNLFEADWSNFLKNYSEAKGNSYAALTFAIRYPVTTAIAQSDNFKNAFPILSEYFVTGSLSDDKISKLANELLSTPERYNFQPDAETQIGQLSALIIQTAKKIMGQQLASGTLDDTTKNIYFTKMNFWRVRLSDLGSQFISIVPSVDTPSGTSYKIGNLQYSYNERAKLMSEFAIEGFYVALTKLLSGTLNHDLFDRQVALLDWNKIPDLLSLARSYDSSANFRDLPSVVTGPFQIDGEGTDGYLEVSEDAKNSLAQVPWIVLTVRSQATSDGKTRWFVKYERPSVKNYSSFINKLPYLLKYKLLSAQANGVISDPTSPASRELTQEIVEAIATSVYANDLSLLVQIGPFADVGTTRYVESFLWRLRSSYIPIATIDLLKGVSALEMREFNSQATNYSSVFNQIWFDPAFLRDPNQAFDLNHDLGIWEIAANYYDVKDPAAFISAVKKRFQDSDVQAWISENEDLKVMNALHTAAQNL